MHKTYIYIYSIYALKVNISLPGNTPKQRGWNRVDRSSFQVQNFIVWHSWTLCPIKLNSLHDAAVAPWLDHSSWKSWIMLRFWSPWDNQFSPLFVNILKLLCTQRSSWPISERRLNKIQRKLIVKTPLIILDLVKCYTRKRLIVTFFINLLVIVLYITFRVDTFQGL